MEQDARSGPSEWASASSSPGSERMKNDSMGQFIDSGLTGLSTQLACHVSILVHLFHESIDEMLVFLPQRGAQR